MIDLTLLRLSHAPEGTPGVLMRGKIPFAVTLELPWKENRRKESCIPAGLYKCLRVQSPRFGDTFEVTGVAGRSHILFHKGNTIDDTEGCILVAEEFGRNGGALAVVNSGGGYAEFMRLLASFPEFRLRIIAPPVL